MILYFIHNKYLTRPDKGGNVKKIALYLAQYGSNNFHAQQNGFYQQ
jgi:hypothetical protein